MCCAVQSVPVQLPPDRVRIVYRCARTHSPHPPLSSGQWPLVPWLFTHSVPVYSYSFAASCSPDCSLIVYHCTCTHSPRHPPSPGHSSPDCLLIVYQCTCTHSPHPLLLPGPAVGRGRARAGPDYLLIVYQCARTHSPHYPPLTVGSSCTSVPVLTLRILLPPLAQVLRVTRGTSFEAEAYTRLLLSKC
jgi:hypothetical protein